MPTPATQMRRYRRLLQAGQCVRCLTPGQGAYARCAACRAKQAQATHRYRTRLRAQGLCTQCGQHPGWQGKGRCLGCRRKMARAYREGK